MEQSKNAFAKALKVLQEAKEEVAAILAGDEHSYVLLGISAHLDKTINRLGFLSGQGVSKPSGDGFAPITEGLEGFERTPLLTEEDLDPEQADREAFLNKVEVIEEAILSMDPMEVLKTFTQPDDVLALRGVAKRAGVEDYETAELTVAFVESIAAALEEAAAAEAALELAEQEVAELEAAATPAEEAAAAEADPADKKKKAPKK